MSYYGFERHLLSHNANIMEQSVALVLLILETQNIASGCNYKGFFIRV